MTQFARHATSDPPLMILQQAVEQFQAQTQVEPLVNVAIQALQTAFDFSVIWIAFYDPQTHILTSVSGVSPKGESEISRLKLTVVPGTLFDQVLMTGQSLAVPNLQAESRADKWQALAQTFNVQGTLLYPICYQKQVLGMVLLGSPRWGNNPRTEEVMLLSTLITLLGTHLYTLQDHNQPQTSDHLATALLSSLAKSTELHTLEDRIRVLLQQLHPVFNPSHTSFYQFDPDQQRFYRQLTQQPRGKGRLGTTRSSKVEIEVQESPSFFQALQAGQVVAVSDIHSFANCPVPNRWMHQLQMRSLLSAPVIFQGQLLGFLALECNSSRLWQESEKQFLQGAAQVLGLHLRSQAGGSSGSLHPQATPIEWLLSLLSAMGQDKAWEAALQKALLDLCKRFQAQRAILCEYHPDSQQYIPRAQIHTSNKQKGLELPLKALSTVDTQMLTRSTSATAIGNLEEDLRFVNWRDHLLAMKIQSLMVANLVTGQAPDWVLILGSSEVRLWSTTEADQLQKMAVDLAPLLTQHQALMTAARRDQLTQQIHQSLQRLQTQPQNLSAQLLNILTQLYPAATSILVLWEKLESAAIQHRLDPDPISAAIPEALQDPLLEGLREQGTIPYRLLAPSQLAPSTRDWLALPNLKHLLVIPLKNDPDSLGVLLLSHSRPLGWSAEPIEPCVHLVQTFAHLYHTQQTLQRLKQNNTALECLNWYKQRQLEFHCQTIMTHYEHLYDVMSHVTPRLSRDKRELGAFALLDSIKAIETLLKAEGWRLQQDQTPIAITTLLRRLLERIEPVTQGRRLWTKVHNQTQALTLHTAVAKLELILLELLLAACYRSQVGQSIDLWCRVLNDQWLEFSITDAGHVNPQLLEDLEQSRLLEAFAPDSLEQVPGRHLRICQKMAQQLGGRLEILQLEDGRTLSRMTLPLTH
ncbi:GAF domain-containing protein [Synechococcales cyanobacterium C]|uniref:GAF domain-containing protein n=1 Tax=Petrachloros mirabilis ULC683 TaxID=2781853 RepID=A0A8K2A9Y0_9CYAN|nr:GAF domain-containing protein [Petrachloros mirabilis]NCJ08739.1 GAF domain-containing protein [Petrachloros mirabilis ULC683]